MLKDRLVKIPLNQNNSKELTIYRRLKTCFHDIRGLFDWFDLIEKRKYWTTKRKELFKNY